MAHLQARRKIGGGGREKVIAAVTVAGVFFAAQSGGLFVRASMAEGVLVRAKAVVDYAARAVSKNRNFTGDLRRSWQHLFRAGERRRSGDFEGAARHAIRARELGRRAIVANGWKLKRAFMRDTHFEKSVMSGVSVGELDRAVYEVSVREEFGL